MALEKIALLAKNAGTHIKPSTLKGVLNRNQLAQIDFRGLRYVKSAPKIDTFEKVSTEVLKPFKNKQEIISYFESIGVKVDLRSFSEQDLRTFARIRNEIIQMEKMGVRTTKPKRIVLSDWSKTDETIQMFDEVNVNCRNMLDYLKTRRAYTHVNSDTVFINSSPEAQMFNKGKSFKKFRHEMGHRNHYVSGTRTDGSNSVLGQGNSDLTFLEREMRVLGRNDWQLLSSLPSQAEGVVRPELVNIANPIKLQLQGEACAQARVFVAGNPKPVPLKIDTSRMVQAMNAECKCYNPKNLSEQVAEMFEDLLKGRTFSDRTMLMYDFAGGPRIPNLKINGLSYDDYIKSLYKNKDLIEELKSYILIS